MKKRSFKDTILTLISTSDRTYMEQTIYWDTDLLRSIKEGHTVVIRAYKKFLPFVARILVNELLSPQGYEVCKIAYRPYGMRIVAKPAK